MNENRNITINTKEEKKLIYDMLEHLYLSQIEEEAEKYQLRPGMGLAGPQVGVNKNFFVVCHEEEEGIFKDYNVALLHGKMKPKEKDDINKGCEFEAFYRSCRVRFPIRTRCWTATN